MSSLVIFLAAVTNTNAETFPIPAAPAPMTTVTAKSWIQLTPAQRGADYIQAFNLLKKEKGTDKVYFQLTDGSQITSVVEITPMTEYSLLFIRYSSPQGMQSRIVPLENIAALGTL